MRDEFDLSASANLITPSSPIVLTVSSENELEASDLLPGR
jgi:hypothetical protein